MGWSRGAVLGALATLALQAAAAGQDTLPAQFDDVLAGRSVLRRGDRGEAVAALQRLLNDRGASPRLRDDGDFGANTETAVKIFQRARNLLADGVVGKRTLERLLGRSGDVWESVTPHAGIRPGDPACYEASLDTAAARHGNLARNLLKALIYQESRFDAGATSDTGAAGIAQFTLAGRAEVRRLIGIRRLAARYDGEDALLERLRTIDRDKVYNPKTAIEASALLLSFLLEQYDGDAAAALTHYNAGGNAGWAVHQYGFDGARTRGYLDDSQARTYAPDVLDWKRRFDGGWNPAITGTVCPDGETSTPGIGGNLERADDD